MKINNYSYNDDDIKDQDFWQLLDRTWGKDLEDAQLQLYRNRTGKYGLDLNGETTEGFETWMADYTMRLVSWCEALGEDIHGMAARADADLRSCLEDVRSAV